MCVPAPSTPSVADLRDGSLKGTLKVILALAQHYHPMSIRHSVNRGRNLLVQQNGGRDSVASTPYYPTYSPVQQLIMADESLSQDGYGAEGGLPPHYVRLPGGGDRRTMDHHTPPPFHPYYEPTKGHEESEQTNPAHTSGTPSPEFGGVSPIPSVSSFAPVSRSYVAARDTPISGGGGVIAGHTHLRWGRIIAGEGRWLTCLL